MKKRFKIGLIISLMLTLNAAGFAQLVHPGGWLNQADLSRIREKVASGEEPWASAWNDIKNKNTPLADVASPMTDGGALQSQGEDAYVLAIKWVVTGDQKFADEGIAIVDTWVNTVDTFNLGTDTPLRIGLGANMMANAAEVLAHGFNGGSGWSPTSISNAQTWFKDLVYPLSSTGPRRSLNWGTACVAGNMAMAIFCDDMTMFNDAIDAYKFGFTNTHDGCAGVTQYIINEEGQCYESGRDQAHAQGGIAHLVEPAMIAWNQGVNLVSYENNRLVAGMEYSAKYNLGNDVSWTSDIYDPCNLNFGWTDGISDDRRGNFSPVYVMARTLFEYAGVDHPYTNEVTTLSSYFPEKGNADHPGMGYLLYSAGTSDTTCKNTTAKIEAECYDAMFGVETEASEDDETENIGNVHNGDWVAYNRVNLSDVYSVRARVASIRDGVSIEVRLDGVDGELLATIPVTNTGGWQTWETVQENIDVVDGFHNVYFVFTGGGGGILNANWFGFSEEFICSNTIDLIEAECYDNMLGIGIEGSSEGTLNIGWVSDGDWTSYKDIDLSNMNSIKARVSSKVSGSIIEVRLDAKDGDVISEIPVTNTEGDQNWVTDSVDIVNTEGTHDVYLVFTGAEGSLVNVNHFGFSEERIVVTSIHDLGNIIELEIKPNPVVDEFRVLGKNGASLELYNTAGQLLIAGQINSNDDQFDVSHLEKGVYVIRVIDGEHINRSKIVKE